MAEEVKNDSETEKEKIPPTVRLSKLLDRPARKSEMLRRLKATAYKHGIEIPEESA